MGLLNRTIYNGKWSEVKREKVSNAEIAMIENNVVTSSEYGLSLCCFLKGGGCTYMKLSRDSKLGIGESMNLEEARIITLARPGNETMEVIIEQDIPSTVSE